MSAPTLDTLAPHFERLRTLDPRRRAEEIAQLSLDTASRARLERLLAADDAEGDPIAEAIAHGAARLHAGGPREFGAWRLVRELGAGGMGTVFLAERADGQFEREVAIKLLRGFPTRDATRRLRQERQILAGLDHPNIARLLDGGETDEGQPWLALEYVDGVPLLDHIALHAPALRDRLALFEAMLDAVAHAHSHLVVHRDIKPANVMVAADGSVKLLDFGIARLVEAGESSQRETSTRVFSRGYASPEQEQGRAITTASDIYSLGVLLREMLEGRRDATDVRASPIDPLRLDAARRAGRTPIACASSSRATGSASPPRRSRSSSPPRSSGGWSASARAHAQPRRRRSSRWQRPNARRAVRARRSISSATRYPRRRPMSR
jgi:serine/threonine-protein kinase